jgi:hypothetical protein
MKSSEIIICDAPHIAFDFKAETNIFPFITGSTLQNNAAK